MSRAQLVLAAIVLAIIAGAAFLLLSPKAPEPAREVVMTGSEFAREYNEYKLARGIPGEGSYDFPSLAPGDILRVRDRIASIEYDNRTRATAVVLSGFEAAPALQDGLFFAGNLTGKFKVGDQVELTFHVVQGSVTLENASPRLVELLDELNGKARERSPDGIPATVIRKYG